MNGAVMYVPDLAGYDLVMVNISGGKDSQAALDVTVAEAAEAGVSDRLVAVHCDLGEEDEWPGTGELAAEHAHHYGLRFEVVRREIVGTDGIRRPQGLLGYIASRPQQKWPDASRRFCTSSMKRDVSLRLMTRLVAEVRCGQKLNRPLRVLNVFGLRAEESYSRARQQPFGPDARASNRTVRHIDRWLPIHDWTTADVWDRIALAGTRPHLIYSRGLTRLSCRFCVLAPRSALVVAARLDPEGARKRAELEERMGHRFRNDVSMREIATEAATGPRDRRRS